MLYLKAETFKELYNYIIAYNDKKSKSRRSGINPRHGGASPRCGGNSPCFDGNLPCLVGNSSRCGGIIPQSVVFLFRVFVYRERCL